MLRPEVGFKVDEGGNYDFRSVIEDSANGGAWISNRQYVGEYEAFNASVNWIKLNDLALIACFFTLAPGGMRSEGWKGC